VLVFLIGIARQLQSYLLPGARKKCASTASDSEHPAVFSSQARDGFSRVSAGQQTYSLWFVWIVNNGRYARMLVNSDEVYEETDKVCSELCDPNAKKAKAAKRAKRACTAYGRVLCCGAYDWALPRVWSHQYAGKKEKQLKAEKKQRKHNRPLESLLKSAQQSKVLFPGQ
jgi:hypothetical protein